VKAQSEIPGNSADMPGDHVKDIPEAAPEDSDDGAVDLESPGLDTSGLSGSDIEKLELEKWSDGTVEADDSDPDVPEIEDEVLYGPREATSADLMEEEPEESILWRQELEQAREDAKEENTRLEELAEQADPEDEEPTEFPPNPDFSEKEDTIFEKATKNGKRRLQTTYQPLKDYSCIINKKCPKGKTCITTSSGKEFARTNTWDVPGNDLVQYNGLENAQACADKCEGYGSKCQSFLFTKEGFLYGGRYRGRCWLKTKKTTDGYKQGSQPCCDFFDLVSNSPSYHPNLMR
jgi:hypothetical protein